MEKNDRKKSLIATLMQLIRFNIVGVINAAVDWIVYTVLVLPAIGTPVLLAQAIGYVCGMINSYIMNSRWTFKGQGKRSAVQILAFIAVNAVSLGVSEGIMWLCGNEFGITNPWLMKLISTPFALVVNYIGNRLFVFRDKDVKDVKGDMRDREERDRK